MRAVGIIPTIPSEKVEVAAHQTIGAVEGGSRHRSQLASGTSLDFMGFVPRRFENNERV
jgi:hypothetical protein